MPFSASAVRSVSATITASTPMARREALTVPAKPRKLFASAPPFAASESA